MTDYHYFSLSALTDRKPFNNNDHLLINTTHPINNGDVHLNITYTAFEILVGIIAVIGNLMVIIVFKRDRKLRRRTNYYIVSLAVADFLVGLFGVPFAILTSIGQPQQKHACLLSLSTLIILCTISIFCLVAVSVDRYWAILYPMAYSRTVRTKTAIGMISICWVTGTIFGLIPLFGVHQKYNDSCFFEKVMDYNYLLVLYFATIITPALLLLAFYAHIYRVIVRQIRQIVTMNPIGECSRRSSSSVNAVNHNTTTLSTNNRIHTGGGMLRVLGAARKRDVKATQNLSIIVLFFMFCWIPLYTINCITAFNPSITISDEFKMCCIIITHLNSAVNPILYAYHLKDFRAALKNLLLKIFGFENDPPQEIAYRLSLASQHRLQSMNNNDKRSSIQNRIYVDSPVWLRQQQQLKSKPANSSLAISCSLNSVHHTVAAVATATADINRDIWKIVEVSSCSHDDDNILNHCKKISESYRKNSQIEENNEQFSYDNKNFRTTTLNDYDDNKNDDDVFSSKDKKNSKMSLASLIREKLHPPEADHYEMNILKLDDNLCNERYIPNFNDDLSSPASSIAFKTIIPNGDTKLAIQMKEDINRNNSIKARNSIYHIEAVTNELPLHQRLTNQVINHKIHHRRSISCNNNLAETESIIYTGQQDDSNIYKFDKFSSIKMVNNFIYPKAKHSNSLFHIYDTTNENDHTNYEKTRKRTTSAES